MPVAVAMNKSHYRAGCFLVAAIVNISSSAFAQEQSDDELVKQLNNPVASLISVPFQNNFEFGGGPNVCETELESPPRPLSCVTAWTRAFQTDPRLAKQSFGNKCVPKLEFGNEKGETLAD